ncbi:TPA: 3-deoxy-7-phosphoheptulonate synthase [Candidatus Acetothermia bacterium]|nr:3-deoxy-7-phosphoheptulonate synthase [Candidatus Acetothermia bacterium]
MIVVMKPGATQAQIAAASEKLVELGFRVHISQGVNYTILGAIGDKQGIDPRELEVLDGVQQVVEVGVPYKLASRAFHPLDTRIELGGLTVGGREVVVIAGPCAVESESQILTIARAVAEAGAHILRGGAFKPRTSPYSFQGLGEEGLRLLRQAADELGMPVVTEVMDTSQVELVARYADILQIGARNMQNFNLLREVGKVDRPVVLKRGLSATLTEFLMAAEYIMSEGNEEVILCERGIRTFSDHSRFTLDLTAVPVLKREAHLPVIVDPSHATGKRELVPPLARAAVAAGADGIMVEVHHQPDRALSDGPQALLPEQFAGLVRELAVIGSAIGRGLAKKANGSGISS